mgnify:CR=1 FL=1
MEQAYVIAEFILILTLIGLVSVGVYFTLLVSYQVRRFNVDEISFNTGNKGKQGKNTSVGKWADESLIINKKGYKFLKFGGF